MMADKREDYVCFPGVVQEIEGSILISLLEFNGLIKIEKNTGEAQFIDYFMTEKQEYQLHVQTVTYQNKVFFVPWNTGNIAIYDLIKEEVRYVPVNNCDRLERFVAGLRHGKYLYLMSETAIRIVQFDMEKEKIVSAYKLEDSYEGKGFWDVRPIKLNGHIWRISGQKNKSWKFDLQSNQYIVLEHLFEQEVQLVTGCIGKEYFWVIAENDIVYQMSAECKYIDQYDIATIMNQVYKEEKRKTLDCTFLNDMLIVVSHCKKCLIKIPVIDGKLNVEKYQCQQFNNAFFSVGDAKIVIMVNNKLIFMEDAGEKEIVLNMAQNFFATMVMKNKYKLKERDCSKMGLDSYIDYICKDKGNLLSNIESDNNVMVGKKIFDIVNEE